MSINVKIQICKCRRLNSHPMYSFDFLPLVKMCIGKNNISLSRQHGLPEDMFLGRD